LCEEVELDDDGEPIPPVAKKTAPNKPVAKKSVAKAEPPKRRCRVRGQNYSLADSELPYCAMTPAQQKAAALARSKANSARQPRRPQTDEERFEALYDKGSIAPAKPAAIPARKPAAAA